MAAKILTLRRQYEHITPILKEIHWLPVEHHITLLTTHRALNGKAPQYITYQPPTYQRAISDLKEKTVWYVRWFAVYITSYDNVR